MSFQRFGLVGAVLASLALSTADAQTGSRASAASGRSEVVRERLDRGVAARCELGAASRSTSDLAAGVIWTYSGTAPYPTSIAIGDHGSEVVAAPNSHDSHAALFSVFDTNPPTPLWTEALPESFAPLVAAANDTDTVVVANLYDPSQPTSTVVVSKHSKSGTPDWTYTFARPYVGSVELGISRDGQRIVVLIAQFAAAGPGPATGHMLVFSPDSNVPTGYTSLLLGGAINTFRSFDLSADGSTLCFSMDFEPASLFVYDVATLTKVFRLPLSASAIGLSGDGSLLAYAYLDSVWVWHRTGTTYVQSFHTGVPNTYANAVDVSDDGKTIACGFDFMDGKTVQIEAVDVPSHTLTMTDVVTSTDPTLGNIISSIAISADGRRFAVGLWGDGPGPVAEARLYARDQDAPIQALNLNGSVFCVAISADGQRFAAGSKAGHANLPVPGGEIDLLGDATPFTNFCYQNGALDTPCPCGNPGIIGHGCNNSRSSGGALLTASGSVSPDTVVLTSSSELPAANTIFLQGQSAMTAGMLFGDGVLCVKTNVKRLAMTYASQGTAVFPAAGDPSITARSSALGDPILPGTPRFYQAYYRDPVTSFCPPPLGDAFNASNAVEIDW